MPDMGEATKADRLVVATHEITRKENLVAEKLGAVDADYASRQEPEDAIIAHLYSCTTTSYHGLEPQNGLAQPRPANSYVGFAGKLENRPASVVLGPAVEIQGRGKLDFWRHLADRPADFFVCSFRAP